LHGPVRAADSLALGNGKLTLSLVGWDAGKVASTTHAVELTASKWNQKPEPVSPRLLRTVPHPDRKAGTAFVQFAPDGQLLVLGYPSGVFQVIDPATGKEVRTIETPRGYRGSHHYARLSADAATLYVGLDDSKFEPIQVGEKKTYFRRYGGEVRVYDVRTGERKEPLVAEPKRGVMTLAVSPDGKRLATMEYDSGKSEDFDKLRGMYLWDVATRKATRLRDGYGTPTFTPDGARVFVTVEDYAKKTAELFVYDAATGKEVGKLAIATTPWSGPAFSPDGKRFAAGTLDADRKPVVRLYDTATLGVAATIPTPEPDGAGAFVSLKFSPDGKHLAGAKKNVVAVWDAATGEVIRSWTLDTQGLARYPTWDPSGTRLAASARFIPPELSGARDEIVTPEDFPQPRVFLMDLGSEKAETVICPHGWSDQPAFSPDGKYLAIGGAGATHVFDAGKRP